MSKGWIGVDLDGTAAHYSKWGNLLDIGEPVWPMIYRINDWIRDGYEVRIMTARIAPPYVPDTLTREDVERAIQNWTEEHTGYRLAVTCSKDLNMIELWDDRAVQVEPNTGEPTTYWVSRVQ